MGLPHNLDIRQACAAEEVLEGVEKLSIFQRIESLCVDGDEAVVAEISYRVAFYQDEQYRRYAQTSVSAVLPLTCQRCLETVDFSLESSNQVMLVRSDEEAEAVLEDADPVIVPDAGLPVVDLIEEELLLSMPSVPMHDDCSVPEQVTFREKDEAEAGQDGESENPFAILATLKRGGTE